MIFIYDCLESWNLELMTIWRSIEKWIWIRMIIKDILQNWEKKPFKDMTDNV